MTIHYNFDVFVFIINNFELFNDFLKSIKKHVIKIKKKIYSNKNDLIRMQNKKKFV